MSTWIRLMYGFDRGSRRVPKGVKTVPEACRKGGMPHLCGRGGNGERSLLFLLLSIDWNFGRRFSARKIWPCGFLFVFLQPFSASGRLPRRDAGVVDRGGLENR